MSDELVSSRDILQGTVLSPSLFTLYTSDFKYNSESCHPQKSSDDIAVVECNRGGEETEYTGLVDHFVEWCGADNLMLNEGDGGGLMKKIAIQGEEVQVVDDYKYLGVHLDNKLEWNRNIEAVYRTGQHRLYFLTKLKSFNVCKRHALSVCGSKRIFVRGHFLERHYQNQGQKEANLAY